MEYRVDVHVTKFEIPPFVSIGIAIAVVVMVFVLVRRIRRKRGK